MQITISCQRHSGKHQLPSDLSASMAFRLILQQIFKIACVVLFQDQYSIISADMQVQQPRKALFATQPNSTIHSDSSRTSLMSSCRGSSTGRLRVYSRPKKNSTSKGKGGSETSNLEQDRKVRMALDRKLMSGSPQKPTRGYHMTLMSHMPLLKTSSGKA